MSSKSRDTLDGSILASIHELNQLFALTSVSSSDTTCLSGEIIDELHSIQRSFGLSLTDLHIKWEAYCLKMKIKASQAMTLNLLRDFRQDLHNQVSVLARSAHHSRSKPKLKRAKLAQVTATAGTVQSSTNISDILGEFITPALAPPHPAPESDHPPTDPPCATPSSPSQPSAPPPSGDLDPDPPASYELTNLPAKHNAAKDYNDVPNVKIPSNQFGRIFDSLNPHLTLSTRDTSWQESRVKIKPYTDISKFAHRTMGMKISEAAEVLDDRIEEFMALVQDHYQFDDDKFGNPVIQSISPLIAVGRIVCDTPDGQKLFPHSMLLEPSLRVGSGLRVPINVDRIDDYAFFPGKIVAFRGCNPTGEEFIVLESIPIPLLDMPSTSYSDFIQFNNRLINPSPNSTTNPPPPNNAIQTDQVTPLTVIVASGPYTTHERLFPVAFKPFLVLLEQVKQACADLLILCGPFLDLDHPSIRLGDVHFPLEPGAPTVNNSDVADVFKFYFSTPINNLCTSMPSLKVIICSSVRDIINRHVSWPQDRLAKASLGLSSKQVLSATNPITLGINEIVIGMSTQDVFNAMRFGECVSSGCAGENIFHRLSRQLIEQRHFFPVFPPPLLDGKSGDKPHGPFRIFPPSENEPKEPWSAYENIGFMLEVPYLKLADWLGMRPDILISPSVLTPFVKVVDSVIVVNPGTLCKSKGAGTFAKITIHPMSITPDLEQSKSLPHKVYQRARVDIIKI